MSFKDPVRAREYKKDYDLAHKEKRREAARIWRGKNREKCRGYARQWDASHRQERRDAARNRRVALPEGGKDAVLRRDHGISLSLYNKILSSQNGVCGVCGNTQIKGRKYLSVDHDHLTGQVRGLLCTSCNGALGLMKDDPERIKNLFIYAVDARLKKGVCHG